MDIINILSVIGFKKIHNNIFESSSDYKIRVEINTSDHTKSTIDYGDKIIVWNKSTSNFKNPENIVVLEAVIRLLNKGYLPNSIELEKTWPSGHGTSGRLDILLRDNSKKTFAMIECKTWGEEYVKERANMIENGGQLFSYAIQENSTKLIMLYSSRIIDKELEYLCEAIEISKFEGDNSEELHKAWDKTFINESIFADESTPYFQQKKNLRKKDLKELDEDTGKGLFNGFAEILRRYAVSDKTNAFNKIFNLFVCKIYDEDTKNHLDELDFQWKINDSFESLIKRLSSLYVKGVQDFLEIDIQKKYFSVFQEFAFIDIFNDDTFNKNFSLVKEVVEFLQNYQIKYTSKHQFLGDFFEDLLNSGVKQEAGQFFTPTPLARFFLKSMPIKKIINTKIDNKEQDVLPLVIDYACGAGHFLSEAIDEIEEHIKKIDYSKLVGRSQKHFLSIKDNYFWAKDFIYGIEKDYRLAKTTKVAMFLYGDGDAIIVNGDGLDDFYSSSNYTGALKASKKIKNLKQFDIVVSNPPFSISGFKQDIADGKENFSLFSYTSNKSKEIECFFVERMFQLLKENGYAGIILPLSILNNENKIYTETRKLLLINFELCALVELRDKTFKPTNTTTTGLFLRKRSNTEIINAIKKCIQIVQSDKSEIIPYLESTFPDLDFSNKHLKKQLNDINHTSDISGIDLSLEAVLLVSSILNQDNKTVIAYAGEKKEQEKFLGYRFSKSRGREGLDQLENSLLFNPKELEDNQKVNSHILASFYKKELEIPKQIEKHVKYISTNKLFEKDNLVINNPSQYFESDNFVIETNSPLGDFIDEFPQTEIDLHKLIKDNKISYIGGLVYNKKSEVPRKTDKRVITASNLDLKTGKLVFGDKIIHLKEDYEIPSHLTPQKNDIVISNSSGSLKHLGKVAYVEEDINDAAIGGFLSIIRVKDQKLAKAIFYRLSSLAFRKHVASLRGQNINNLDLDKLKTFKFTVPKNLDKFYKTAIQKEKDLADIIQKMNQLKNEVN